MSLIDAYAEDGLLDSELIAVSAANTLANARYFKDVILRNNYIRDVQATTEVNRVGIRAAQTVNFIVEGNIIGDTTRENAVKFGKTDAVKVLYNRMPSGVSLRAYNFDTGQRAPELDDKVIDSYLNLLGGKAAFA